MYYICVPNQSQLKCVLVPSANTNTIKHQMSRVSWADRERWRVKSCGPRFLMALQMNEHDTPPHTHKNKQYSKCPESVWLYRIYNRSDLNASPYHRIITLQTTILHTNNNGSFFFSFPFSRVCCTEQQITASSHSPREKCKTSAKAPRDLSGSSGVWRGNRSPAVCLCWVSNLPNLLSTFIYFYTCIHSFQNQISSRNQYDFRRLER